MENFERQRRNGSLAPPLSKVQIFSSYWNYQIIHTQIYIYIYIKYYLIEMIQSPPPPLLEILDHYLNDQRENQPNLSHYVSQ